MALDLIATGAFMSKARLHITVSGTVQGVFFRATACEMANRLGLTGWVRNTEGGDGVEIVAEGDKKKLDEFLPWCAKGPKGARVEKMDYAWSDFRGGFERFILRR